MLIKQTVNKLEAYLNNKNSVHAQTVSHNGVSASAKKSGSQTNSSMTAKKVAKNEKAMKANSAKKASMPQTGEANNAGILAGIGALAIAVAGAFLFRKRG